MEDDDLHWMRTQLAEFPYPYKSVHLAFMIGRKVAYRECDGVRTLFGADGIAINTPYRVVEAVYTALKEQMGVRLRVPLKSIVVEVLPAIDGDGRLDTHRLLLVCAVDDFPFPVTNQDDPKCAPLLKANFEYARAYHVAWRESIPEHDAIQPFKNAFKRTKPPPTATACASSPAASPSGSAARSGPRPAP